METTFRIRPGSLRDFNNTLRAYIQYCSSALSQIVNEKAYFISLAALEYTHKADINKVKSEIGITGREIIGYRIKSVSKKEFYAQQAARDRDATLRAFGGIRKEA